MIQPRPRHVNSTTPRDVGHAKNAREGLKQFMEMDGWMDGRTEE